MPLVSAPSATGMSKARGRVSNVAPAAQGAPAPVNGEGLEMAPAKAGPAVVVQISDAARFLSLGVSNPAINDLSKPGLNNGTMAAEGGAAADLRGKLTQRYAAEVDRLSQPLG